MKLVASAIVRNERGRYLEPWIEHLLSFCDSLVLIDDASTDGTYDWLVARGRGDARFGRVLPMAEAEFDSHEGRARQALLDVTLQHEPTHVLAIDADEFISDGARLREIISAARSTHRSWALPMREIWEVGDDGLCQREDGGWRAHKAPVLWTPPPTLTQTWRINDKALACGRIPTAVRDMRATLVDEVSILHFGWANETERQARYDRYMRIDGGRFHNRAHLQSIMAPCERIRLVSHPWPAALEPWREQITSRTLEPPA